MKVKVTQLCPALCDPMDCIVHGILQARILGWVAFHFLLQGIFPIQGSNPGFLHFRWILYRLSYHGSLRILKWVACPFLGDHPDPGIELGSPALQVDSLPAELLGKPYILAIDIPNTLIGRWRSYDYPLGPTGKLRHQDRVIESGWNYDWYPKS